MCTSAADLSRLIVRFGFHVCARFLPPLRLVCLSVAMAAGVEEGL